MKAYKKVARQFSLAFQSKPLSKITTEDILEWRKNRLEKIRPTTWNNLVRHLHSIFKFGIEQGYLSQVKNPFKSLSLKVGKLPKKTISDSSLQQIETILNEEPFLPDILKPKWFIITLINTLRYTAIRRRQLLNLKLSDIDLEKKLMTLPADYNKNHDYHIIPISDKLVSALENLILEHRKRKSLENAQLFNINLFCRKTRRKGLNMSDDQLSHLFRVISELVSASISPHRFRHTTATALMRKNTNNLYNVQKLLGHKDIKTTLGYVEDDPEMIRDCLNSL